MDVIGPKLEATRAFCGLTLRDVEQRSLDLAQRWGNPAYRISASWLYRVERENGGLSAAKLIVLARIYSLTAEQMLALLPLSTAPSAQFDESSAPNATLLTQGPLESHAQRWLPDSLITDTPPDATGLVPSAEGIVPGRYLRGIIGLQDVTLDPMVPPGSMVLIDSEKVAIAGRREWNHEFDRPLYFFMTRQGYLAGFCELDEKREWLTVIPHALSSERNRRWRYRNDIQVVGRIVALSIRRMNRDS